MIRSGIRKILQKVGQRVAKDNLFEQPGERQPTPPLARKEASARPPSQAIRPLSGCRPIHKEELKAALIPNGKALVINHWATWCEPCVDELPRLVRAAAGIADHAEFFGISWDLFDHPNDPQKAADQVARFADSYGVGYGSLLFTGSPEELFQICGLSEQTVPQTIVIGPDGKIRWSRQGPISDDDVFPLIKAAKGL